MPLQDITKPEVIKFLIESYEKTNRLRMKWKEKHGASLEHAATLQREAKGYYEADVIKAEMVAGMAAITRDHVSAGCNRRRTAIRDAIYIPGIASLRKGHSIPETGLGDVNEDPRLNRPDTDLSIDPKMRPMDPKQRNIIYKDIPVFGRKVYLKNRSRTLPEDRYYFRETGGWEYGWRMKDSFFQQNSPKYGRVWSLTRDVMSLTGPQPDPPHYKRSDIPGVSKCLH